MTHQFSVDSSGKQKSKFSIWPLVFDLSFEGQSEIDWNSVAINRLRLKSVNFDDALAFDFLEKAGKH
jgi:hypothetical protein